MKTRIVVGVVLFSVLVAALWFGGLAMLILLALFALIAVYEMGVAFQSRGNKPILAPAYVFAAAFGFVFYYFDILSLVTLYMSSLIATMVISLFTPKRTMADVMAGMFVHVYPLLFLMCCVLVYFGFARPVAMTAACMAMVAPEVSDTFAYFGGTWFGKRKLCPRISPKKTVAGSVAALLGGMVFGAIIYFAQGLWDGMVYLTVLLAVGLLCGVFSQFGDLFASTIKRWAGIKDFSSIFPGHGGIMDRIDSILLCAPPVLFVFSVLTKLGVY